MFSLFLTPLFDMRALGLAALGHDGDPSFFFSITVFLPSPPVICAHGDNLRERGCDTTGLFSGSCISFSDLFREISPPPFSGCLTAASRPPSPFSLRLDVVPGPDLKEQNKIPPDPRVLLFGPAVTLASFEVLDATPRWFCDLSFPSLSFDPPPASVHPIVPAPSIF